MVAKKPWCPRFGIHRSFFQAVIDVDEGVNESAKELHWTPIKSGSWIVKGMLKHFGQWEIGPVKMWWIQPRQPLRHRSALIVFE